MRDTLRRQVNQVEMTVFRVVFRQAIKEEVHAFSKVHQYDSRQDFKEAWKEWCDEHIDELEDEYKYQMERGADMTFVDLLHKLYTSARYYHRKKSNRPPSPQKPRTQYIRLHEELLDMMRDHIVEKLEYGIDKPAVVYNDFCEENEISVQQEIKRMREEHDMTKNQVKLKLKKTYKNMYYSISKKS